MRATVVWILYLFSSVVRSEYLQSKPFVASEYNENGVFFPINSDQSAFIEMVNNLDLDYLSQIRVATRELFDMHLNFSNKARAKSILNLARSNEFINVLTSALNETLDNIVFITSDFFCKQPIEYKVIGWHQDQAWFEMIPLNKFINIWVSIDYANDDNGCIQLKLKSHQSNQLFEHPRTTVVNDSFTWSLDIPMDYNGTDAVSANVIPSQAIVFSGLTMHSSNNNISGKRRCGISLRYTVKDWKYKEDARPKIIGDGTIWQPQSLTLDKMVNDFDAVLKDIDNHYNSYLKHTWKHDDL